MNVEIGKNEVVIQSQGIELLKIKAKLAKCIGPTVHIAGQKISFPLSCVDMVKREIPELNSYFANYTTPFDLHAMAREKALAGIKNCDTALIPDKWNDILDLHQQYAVNAMVEPGLLGLCLFDEQGCGKTVMTISAFDILKDRGDINSVIIVCPKNMLSGWKSDIEKFTGQKYQISILQGDNAKKRSIALENWDILISNYEGIEAALVSLNAKVADKKYLLIADESYYAKNANAERSVIVSKLRSICLKCFVLCGTPAPNSPYDLINQFNLADVGYTFSSFIQSSDIDRDRELISEIINSRGTYIRRLKKDIYPNLPGKNFNVISVQMTGRQRELYDRAENDLILELRTFNNKTFKKHLTSYFQKREALLKLCAIPQVVCPTLSEIPVKYQLLDNLLNTLFEQKRKVVLWTAYTASIDELVQRYAAYSPLVVDGRVSGPHRGEAVRLFQTDSSRLLFIANPEAGGPGITLHASHDAVYLSYTNKAASHLQSLDRIHRRGQTANEVNYYYFVCEHTIEETEIMRLRTRELQQHDLLGDSYTWPASLDEAIAELTHKVPQA